MPDFANITMSSSLRTFRAGVFISVDLIMHSSPGLSQVSLILTVSASDSSSAIYNEDCLKPLALRPMCLRVVKVLVLGLTVSPSAVVV